MLNVIILNVIMLNVIMLNVIMLNVIMLSVIMLNVVAPQSPPHPHKQKNNWTNQKHFHPETLNH